MRTYPYEILANMDFETGVQVLSKGFERERKKELWLMYCGIYPHMSTENFVDFEGFVNRMTVQVEVKSKDEIMSEVKDIINMTL